MRTGTFIAVAAVASLGALGAVVANFVVGGRLFEETVVKDPYEAGLRYQKLRQPGGERKLPPGVDCDLDRGPCEKSGPGDLRLRLEVGPRPVKAMADLELTVGAWRGTAPVADRVVQVSFAMPGMYMGENKVMLAPVGAGLHRGKGLLVRCPSGKRIWAAEVSLLAREASGPAPVAVPFTFELAE